MLQTQDGQTVSLADLRGQVVLLNFWATWCPPCRAEMPAIQQVYDQHKDQGFTVLAVDVLEQDDQVDAFVAERGLTVLLATHDVGALDPQHRRIELSDGRIVA